MISAEERKSAREVYTRVAVIDSVIRAGITNIIPRIEFRFKYTNTTVVSPAPVAKKSQIMPCFQM